MERQHISVRVEHVLEARDYGPPAFLAETIAAVERSLVRVKRLRELEAPASILETDRLRSTTGLLQLREFADDPAIVASFPSELQPLAQELLSTAP